MEQEENNTSLEKLEENVAFIQAVRKADSDLDTPVDINLSKTIKIELPPLFFLFYEVITKKVKLKNNGRTMIMNCTWPPKQQIPYLTGGPLNSQYEFSQLHFHWGENGMEGSEHTIDGVKLPLEMHVVHFKSSYLTHEKAVKKSDGILIVVYLFHFSGSINPALQILLDSIEAIENPDTHIRLDNFSLNTLVDPFNVDYFLYFGAIRTSTLDHNVTWVISRQLLKVAPQQIESFRYLYDSNGEAMLRNFRPVEPHTEGRRIFHVNPSTVLYSTLLYHKPPEDEYVKPRITFIEDENEEEQDFEEQTEQNDLQTNQL